MKKICIFLAFLLTHILISEPMKDTVYFIGNSLTMSTTLNRVHALFEQRGIDLQFGSQLSGGKSLIRHLNYKKELQHKWKCWETLVENGDTFEPDDNMYLRDPKEWRFGLHDNALSKHKFSKVIMQMYGGSLHEDYKAICGFIDMALKNDVTDDFVVYSTWPSRKKKKVGKERIALNIDYPAVWNGKYTASVDETDVKVSRRNYYSRDLVNQLMKLLNDKYSFIGKPIKLIPAGEVLLELDKKIKAGQLPGIEELAKRSPSHVPGLDEDTDYSHGVNVLYADGVHLNPIPHQGSTMGIFVSGQCVYTGVSGKSPVGLSGKPYELDDELDAELIKALQETIVSVFQANPYSKLDL